jgi:hypothetical protein
MYTSTTPRNILLSGPLTTVRKMMTGRNASFSISAEKPNEVDKILVMI